MNPFQSLVDLVSWTNLEKLEKATMQGDIQDINVQSRRTGNTILHVCERWLDALERSGPGWDKINAKISFLIANRADPSIRNFDGRSAVEEATYMRRYVA